MFEASVLFGIEVGLGWGVGGLLTPAPRSLTNSVLFDFAPASIGLTNSAVDIGKSGTDLTALTVSAVGNSPVEEPMLVGEVLAALDLNFSPHNSTRRMQATNAAVDLGKSGTDLTALTVRWIRGRCWGWRRMSRYL